MHISHLLLTAHNAIHLSPMVLVSYLIKITVLVNNREIKKEEAEKNPKMLAHPPDIAWFRTHTFNDCQLWRSSLPRLRRPVTLNVRSKTPTTPTRDISTTSTAGWLHNGVMTSQLQLSKGASGAPCLTNDSRSSQGKQVLLYPKEWNATV